MPYRLLSRDRPIPNGISVRDPGTNYAAPPFASFQQQVDGVLASRLANPGFVARYRLSTKREDVENYVDGYLAKVCADNGWTTFITTGAGAQAAPIPFQNPNRARSASRVAAVAAGVKTIYEWITSKEEAVSSELSSARAKTCVDCPQNQKGNLADFFTVQAAAAISGELEKRKGWKLETPDDARLGVCQVCFCVNALSVHCPLEIKRKHLAQEVFDRLPGNCWVKTEG